MQNVSQKWKENQAQPLVSESFVEVTLSVTDPDALADASASDNGAVYFANTPQIISERDKNIVKYATLEHDIWALDGTMELLPTSGFGDTGYVGSALCGADCAFNPAPKITFSFTEIHEPIIPGITIKWGEVYGEYAVDFSVNIYRGASLVAQKTVAGNTDIVSEIELDIENYNKITIEIAKWSKPHHRARISEVFIGIKQIYTKNELMSFEHTQTADPLSASLPKSEIKYGIDNTSGKYNPNNQAGLAKYLIERQQIKAKYGYKVGEGIEKIDGGTFYLSEWISPQNGLTASFTARDLLEFMNDIYIEGTYAPSGVSLYVLAESVLKFAKISLNSDGTVRWKIDESLKNIFTTAPLPQKSCAECLQLIANAACCALFVDRRGTLHIEPAQTSAADYRIDDDNSYEKSEIALTKVLNRVDVMAYQYFTDAKEVGRELYAGGMAVGGTRTEIIAYSAAAINVSAAVTGATLVSAQYFTRACKLVLSGNGVAKVSIKGDLLKVSSNAVSVSNEPKGEAQKVENELITSAARAEIVGNWVKTLLTNRKILSSKWRADPRIDVLDKVINANDYTENAVRITSVKLKYAGAWRGECEGRAE